MSGQPRLLYLAWPFPPLNAIGCVRTWNTAKYLSKLGWNVTVLTPRPSVWRFAERSKQVEAELEALGIRRMGTGHRWRCLTPDYLDCWNHGLGWFVGGLCRSVARSLEIDPQIGWISEARETCAQVMPGSVDLILASGSPFASFGLAKQLSDRLGCPYVVDYRDLWTTNPHAGRPVRSAIVRQETRLVADAAAVAVVSPSMAVALEHQFHLGAKLHVVTNGFDPEELASVKPHPFDHFAIVYTGEFYPPKRIIDPVVKALQQLKVVGARETWRFHYYGGAGAHVQEAAERFGVRNRVVLHGNVARAEALSAVRGAGIAVVITSVAEESSVEDRGILTGKLFESLGLRTPTLVVAPRGSDVESVTQTTGLARRFIGNDATGIASFFAEVMAGQRPVEKNPDVYAWTTVIQRMDAILRSVLEKTQPPETVSKRGIPSPALSSQEPLLKRG
jgi:glycosyltransferase involved in cell wall biosynthesis